jgi:aconitate hydratase
LVKGPLHADLPDFEPIGDALTLPVLLKLGDNLSTDEIVAGGVKGCPFGAAYPA